MWGQILSTAFLGGGVLFSYAIVLFNSFGGFELPTESSRSYLESPYWLGLPRSSTTALLIFQVGAGIGYFMWFVSIVITRPTRGLLADPRWLFGCNAIFLVASAVWPFAAYQLLQFSSTVWRAILACLPLWMAAIGMCLLVGGTFEDDRSSPVALIGILLTSTVVVMVDGVGWSATALYTAIHEK